MTNTWTYLRTHSIVGTGLTDPQFLFGVLIPVLGLVDGRLNIAAMSPAPMFMIDDHWRLATLGAKLESATGLVRDSSPPYAKYRANLNHVTLRGNPFALDAFERRWYTARGNAGVPSIACDAIQNGSLHRAGSGAGISTAEEPIW